MNAFVNATLRTFKAYSENMNALNRNAASANLLTCVNNGYIVVNENGEILQNVHPAIHLEIKALYGTDHTAFNQTFHKSFNTVAAMDPSDYYTQQIFHYITAYIHDVCNGAVPTYIPTEKLEIPNGEFKVDKLVIIRQVSEESMITLINNFALSTVHPSKANIEDFTAFCHYLTIRPEEIKSFELQAIYFDKYKILPGKVDLAFRYLIYKTTDSTLIIKNKRMRETIVAMCQRDPQRARIAYDIIQGVPATAWAEIFFRYKMIFLAYKKAVPSTRATINRIRRLADDLHKPIGENNLRNITKLAMECNTSKEIFEKITPIVAKASNRDLVKVANAVASMCTRDVDGSAIYNIRNGKIFVNENIERSTVEHTRKCLYVLNTVYTALMARLTTKLKGKKFYIPEYINYAVPVSEKQFTNNYPWGTYVQAPKNGAFTLGIQWYNHKDPKIGEIRTDLDLHMNSATQHFGWNGNYRNGHEIIFTGDITNAPAPTGAAEAFWFTPEDDDYTVSVNNFTRHEGVEFKFAITEQRPDVSDIRNRNHTFDNPIFAPISFKFSEKDVNEMTVGFLNSETRRFYFYGGSINSGIVPQANYPAFIKALDNRVASAIKLKEMLEDAGAEVISERPTTEEEMKDVIDLSPEVLDSQILLSIVDGTIE